MKYQGIIFDLDGTLAYTLEDIADSMNRVLNNQDFPLHSYEKYKNFVGRGLRNLIKSSLPTENQNDSVIEKCYYLMLEDYNKNCLVKTRLYDGIEEMVKEIRKTNISMAVLSNKAHELTEKIVNALFGNGIFNPVFGALPSVPLKPDPASALQISRLWKINPKNIAYIGDSGVDMITANNAGIFAIGVLWGYRNKQEIINGGAKATIENPNDLTRILETG